MDALKDVTYLDALLLMCLHYKDVHDDPCSTIEEIRDALMCIRDCERRQMELQHHG